MNRQHVGFQFGLLRITWRKLFQRCGLSVQRLRSKASTFARHLDKRISGLCHARLRRQTSPNRLFVLRGNDASRQHKLACVFKHLYGVLDFRITIRHSLGLRPSNRRPRVVIKRCHLLRVHQRLDGIFRRITGQPLLRIAVCQRHPSVEGNAFPRFGSEFVLHFLRHVQNADSRQTPSKRVAHLARHQGHQPRVAIDTRLVIRQQLLITRTNLEPKSLGMQPLTETRKVLL